MWRGIVLTRNQAPAKATVTSSAAAGQALCRVARLRFWFGLSRRMGLLACQLSLELPVRGSICIQLLSGDELVATQQVLQCRWRALVRHVHHVDPRCLVELEA